MAIEIESRLSPEDLMKRIGPFGKEWRESKIQPLRRRWRDDKRPRVCTYEQLEVVPPHELAAIFATRR